MRPHRFALLRPSYSPRGALESAVKVPEEPMASELDLYAFTLEPHYPVDFDLLGGARRRPPAPSHRR